MTGHRISSSSSTWTMEDEKSFIRRLGTWGSQGVPRKELLAAYVGSLLARSRWGVLDRAELRRYALEQLSEEVVH